MGGRRRPNGSDATDKQKGSRDKWGILDAAPLRYRETEADPHFHVGQPYRTPVANSPVACVRIDSLIPPPKMSLEGDIIHHLISCCCDGERVDYRLRFAIGHFDYAYFSATGLTKSWYREKRERPYITAT